MGMDNNEVVAEFVVESQEHLADVESQLLAIEAAGENIDVDLVNTVFRAVHSIKGASGFLGFTTIGELSHNLENILNLMRNRELVPTSAIVDVLLRAADCLRGLIGDIHNSNGVDVSAHTTALKRIIEGGASAEVQTRMVSSLTLDQGGGIVLQISEHSIETQKKMGHQLYVIEFDLIADVQNRGKTPLDLIREVLQYGELLDSRISTDDWGGLETGLPARMRFVTLVGTMIEEMELLASAFGLSPDRVKRALTEGSMAKETIESNVAVSRVEPPPIVAEAPKPRPIEAPEPAATPTSTPSAAGPSDGQSSKGPTDTNIRVSVSVLDRLMNLAGELVLGRNQLLQKIATHDQDGLESVGARLNQVTSELQEAIMQTRMQPIGSVFSKFPRVVRDLSGKLGKQCELTMEGKDVELDKSIIEAIGDPLTHLVRNSVDHGIETPEVRDARGKAPNGTVVLRAFHQAGKVNISISDDGAGIDAAKLKQKAVSRGLITADEARDMSERDALRLIFHPGFSMAEKVTDVSGRGVGMDVVRTNIERLGGRVEIDTEVGTGTTISIKLPLTLAIIPSLVVRCGNARYVIPQVNISELVRIKASEVATKIERVRNAEVLRLRGNLLPLVRLSAALGVQSKYLDPLPNTLKDNNRSSISDRRADVSLSGLADCDARGGDDRREDFGPGALNIIVVEAGHLRYGLIVDGLHDSEEIVVKPLGRHMKGTPCLAGATILGDGKVSLILDIAGMAAHCELAVPDGAEADGGDRRSADAREMQHLLLFTNDPAEQFAVPMGLISRIERIRADQVDTVGGQEVLQYRGTSLPLISLERHIRARPRPEKPQLYVIVFHIGRKEVGMIAPNLVDIREVSTEADTVTFREPGVSGSIVAEDKATRLIDLFELTRSAHPEWFAGDETQTTEATRKSEFRVLLAEDSDFFRNQLRGLLSSEGYEVEACADGQIAWDTLRESSETFNLVVTDIEMPNMDGYDLTRCIKGDPRFAHLPVIAVTSLAGAEDVQRGAAAGIDEYQVKLDRDVLLSAIARLSRSKAVV